MLLQGHVCMRQIVIKSTLFQGWQFDKRSNGTFEEIHFTSVRTFVNNSAENILCAIVPVSTFHFTIG